MSVIFKVISLEKDPKGNKITIMCTSWHKNTCQMPSYHILTCKIKKQNKTKTKMSVYIRLLELISGAHNNVLFECTT